MNQDIIQNSNFQVDNNIDRSRDGSFSSILKARDNTKSNASIQAANLHETTTAMGELNSQLSKFMEYLKNATSEVKKTSEFKEFTKNFKDFSNSFNDARAIVRKGSTDIETLARHTEKCNNAYDAMKVSFDEMSSVYDTERNQLKEISKAKKKQIDLDKADLRLRQEIRKKQSKQIIEEAKESNKSIVKAFQQGAGKLNQVLSSIDIRRSLDQLVDATGRSTAANTQISMMSSYNMNKSEFNSFKHQLYDRIDTSVYSSKEVIAAIGSLEEIGLNSTDEMVSKFDVILRGQQLLGITAQQQAKLQTISNRTGRDFLTFTTNKLAKVLIENNNIGKKQLSELLDLNSNLVSQFADIGISSPEFEDASLSATTALTNLMGGDSTLAQKYTSIMTDLAMNNGASGAKVGLGLDDYYAQLSSGTNLATMISSGRGSLGQLYSQIMSGGMTAGQMSEMVNQGVLTSAERDLLTHMTSYDKQNGTGAFAAYLDSYKGTDNGEALESVEENTSKGTSLLGKITNNFTNWVAKSFDWIDFSSFEQSMKIITTLLGIIAASEAIQGLGQLFGKLGSGFKGTSLLGGSGAGGKLLGAGSFLGGSQGVSLSSYGNGALGIASKAAGIGGLAWAGYDAYKGFTETSKTMYGENATTGQKIGSAATAAVSGSTVHRDSQGNVSMGKNVGMGALSGAGKGALIGSFFGPVGTLVGAGVGALAGAIGGWWKSKKAQEQEKREKEQLEKEKEIAENTAATKDLLAKTGNEVTMVSRKTAGIRSYTGEGSTYHPSARAISGKTGVGASFPWGINSWFNDGRTLSNGDNNTHYGIDWAVPEGTPIGAPIAGTIKSVATDPRNTYYNDYGMSYQQRLNAGLGIYLQGADGNLYQFWHLSKLGVKAGDVVKAGQTIGLSGNTGYSTGAHLHYGVKVNGSWVDPIANNLVHAGLFQADGKIYTPDAAISSDVLSTSGSYPTQKVFTNKIRRFSSVGTGMGAVVEGLAAIKQTLIDLSNRQTRDEQILTMLQGSKKQDPRVA